jgi:hypothetical protein
MTAAARRAVSVTPTQMNGNDHSISVGISHAGASRNPIIIDGTEPK